MPSHTLRVFSSRFLLGPRAVAGRAGPCEGGRLGLCRHGRVVEREVIRIDSTQESEQEAGRRRPSSTLSVLHGPARVNLGDPRHSVTGHGTLEVVRIPSGNALFYAGGRFSHTWSP